MTDDVVVVVAGFDSMENYRQREKQQYMCYTENEILGETSHQIAFQKPVSNTLLVALSEQPEHWYLLQINVINHVTCDKNVLL